MQKLKVVLFVGSFLSGSFAYAESFSQALCPKGLVREGYQILCDQKGVLRIQQSLFDKGTPSLIYSFNEKGRLQTMQSFNYEGELVQDNKYNPQEDGSYLVYSNGQMAAQLEITFNPQMQTRKIKTWNHNNGKLSFVDYYDLADDESNDPIKSEIYGTDEKLEKVYTFKHALVAGIFKVIDQFKSFSPAGKLIGSFNSQDNIRPSVPAPPEARQPVVIIDSGFDYHHPAITPILSQKYLGGYDDPQLLRTGSTDIREIVMLPMDRKPAFPISHGTHVASIAFKDIKKFELVGFAGDYSQDSFLDLISDFVKDQKVPFVNMSFGFGTRENPFGVNDRSRVALLSLMSSNNETLFVVAAGNGSMEVHQERNDDLPASARVPNKLVIAALNQSVYTPFKKGQKLELTKFSNFGTEEVDLAVPGLDVEGALIGGGTVRLSGTSMAAPMAMNTAMKMKEINPALKVLEIKNILCQTAFIPAEPLPVRCKGALDEARALKAAELSISMSIEQAIARSAK